VGQRALALGATHYVVVSALGADPDSSVFYNRIKGEMEAALRRQGWPRLTIVRPSLLTGARQEWRLGETLAAPLMRWAPRRWRAIPAELVARAMWRQFGRREPGIRVIESGDLWDEGLFTPGRSDA